MSPGSVALAFIGSKVCLSFASSSSGGISLRVKKGPVTYAVQKDVDLAACVDGRLFAAQLADFAEDADGLVGELLKVGSGDARGCFKHCGCGSNVLLRRVEWRSVSSLVAVFRLGGDARLGRRVKWESLRAASSAKAREWRMKH